jgi:phosphoribosylformylglycinamidine synthase
VFPGNNCEFDSALAFERAGADPHTFIVNNLTPAKVARKHRSNSSRKSTRAQIMMIPGGFSGGDEPDGSGKFIAAFFRNPKITEAVTPTCSTRATA